MLKRLLNFRIDKALLSTGDGVKAIRSFLTKGELIQCNATFVTNGEFTVVLGDQQSNTTFMKDGKRIVVVTRQHYLETLDALRKGVGIKTTRNVMAIIGQINPRVKKKQWGRVLFNLNELEVYSNGNRIVL